MNLHDFVTEPFNPEHIFRDARTVSICLTTDHISTCLMMFSARFKTAQFWSENWCGSFHGVPWTACVESHGECAWKPGSFDGVPWIAQFGYGIGGVSRQLATDAVVCTVSQCLDSWQRMQWYAPSLSVSTAGNGCSGMHRLTVSRQLATDAVVCTVSQCHDSW